MDKVSSFVNYWKNKGYEKGETQKFWLSFLRDIMEISNPETYIEFERKIKLPKIEYIDALIPDTHILIEQKSRGIDLQKSYKQSDGILLTPFEQAIRYNSKLPYEERARWIITSNFEEFQIHDLSQPSLVPDIVIKLNELSEQKEKFNFLIDPEKRRLNIEKKISLEGGRLIAKLYNALLLKYKNPDDQKTLESLNKLCVRLIFCLYAEDSGVFNKDQFHDYLSGLPAEEIRSKLLDLFKILNTPEDQRDPYIIPKLRKFPYVNGGLFTDEEIEIPLFTDKIKELLVEECSANFDWKDISPTIFGSLFESILNKETRRKGGMYYTSVENIHKVIDPLFLEDLKSEFNNLKSRIDKRVQHKLTTKDHTDLEHFQNKLASLTFFDPAAGSGNFLTETYLSLRRLENEVIALKQGPQKGIAFNDKENSPIKVSINQFYGIEINDFAISVAKTALWIAENQMLKETEKILDVNLDFLPLKSSATLFEGNALRLNWQKILPDKKVSYIFGNPPFSAARVMNKSQKEDLQVAFPKIAKSVDYVTGWYFKAAQYIQNTNIKCALVSTNSICQGEQVYSFWKPLIENYNINIDYAYRTFIWDSEAIQKAHVHVVIIGFSSGLSVKEKVIYQDNSKQTVNHINPYLVGTEDVFIEKHTKSLWNAPNMKKGCQVTDGGFFIFTEQEMKSFLKKEPLAKPFFRPFMMGKDFLERNPRYCLWLYKADPSLLNKCPQVKKRIQCVKNYRLSSPSPTTNRYAERPALFSDVREFCSDYIAIPRVSSGRRKYIPIDYLSSNIIPGDKLYVIENANLYVFGILNSIVHMSFVRAIGGRLKSDYNYSRDFVYNNFPWPKVSESQKDKIETTAQAILNARKLYPNASLADLYDESAMPVELKKAHKENDKAVLEAYGFSKKATEEEIVEELIKLYLEKVEQTKFADKC